MQISVYKHRTTGTWMVQPLTLTAMCWPMLVLRWKKVWKSPRSWVQKTLVWWIWWLRSCNVVTLLCKWRFNRHIFGFLVFWGGRGFHSIHNTDVAVELNHMAIFFKMAVSKCAREQQTGFEFWVCQLCLFCFMSACLSADYKEKIGLSCQFLIAPQQKEPSKHQYDYGEASKAHHKVT